MIGFIELGQSVQMHFQNNFTNNNNTAKFFNISLGFICSINPNILGTLPVMALQIGMETSVNNSGVILFANSPCRKIIFSGYKLN